MKQLVATIAVAGGVFCLSTYAIQAVEILIADDYKTVLLSLGEPMGKIKTGNKEIWTYRQGTIELLYGKVVSVDFLSPAALKQKEAARRRLEQVRLDQLLFARARGESEKRRILSDPGYSNLSAEELMRVWGAFRHRFPETPVDQPAYDAALSKLKKVTKSKPPPKSTVAVEDPGPPPKISGKRKRKLKRAGKWKWGKDSAVQTDAP